MAFVAKRVTVGTSPTLLTTGVVGASWVYLHAPVGGNLIYIGAADVATTSGMELPKGALIEIWLAEADKLYAIVGSNTEVLMVFHSGGR